MENVQKYNIFLDDVRPCPSGYILVETVAECIAMIRSKKLVSHLSLDHDLGSYAKNGFEVVLHLLEHKIFPDCITIHSANAVGGKRMYDRLIEAKRSGQVPSYVKIFHQPLPIGFAL
ncbi:MULTISPECIES: cyclic-phosphate processing receiver domain-containing protein [Sinobaca]|uniref:Cyclic-phosphate processing Receiver domain-containing protein n=2 Tax=Sinobaca TaxID=342943 RepID=A0A419V5I9_9BACL|nr:MULTISPECIES: cyclic-phosphate processing receiver domain-containing protein [Sinobaca]RKD75230.1 hypothetical protein ATL39_0928 [Sinobaca qinghaiensis]